MHASAVPIGFAPYSWRIVFVADDLNCHYAGRARVAKAWAWMLSLTLPRRAERQDRGRIKALLRRAPMIPTGRYRVPGVVGWRRRVRMSFAAAY